jgi:hypothetical protein
MWFSHLHPLPPCPNLNFPNRPVHTTRYLASQVLGAWGQVDNPISADLYMLCDLGQIPILAWAVSSMKRG